MLCVCMSTSLSRVGGSEFLRRFVKQLDPDEDSIIAALPMEPILRASMLLLLISISALSFPPCDAATRSMRLSKGSTRKTISKPRKELSLVNHLDGTVDPSLDSSSNTDPYSPNSPFSLPPLTPFPSSENSPPYCSYPPSPPLPPSTTSTPSSTSPSLPFQSPPGSPTSLAPGPPGSVPGPPSLVPNPTGNTPTSPTTTFPSPTQSGLSPPESGLSPPGPVLSPPESGLSPPSYELSPPSYAFPAPDSNVPSPTGFVPGPPVFLPPVVFPPPVVPPSPNRGPSFTLWCVAKPSVPEPIIQEAMNYACGSGAECNAIQPNGSCYEPNTFLAHASYAFNSYWQRTRVAGGTCDFGGTAMLVSVDPSYNDCKFTYY